MSTFPINLSALPFVATRKALLILDLQNDFVSPDGALPVGGADEFIPRVLELAKAFRDSGAGDVIWVRSEFEKHCPIEPDGEQIVVSDVPPRRTPGRGRRPPSRAQDGAALECDDEAFLSVSPSASKPLCVRKDTAGAKFPPHVQDAVVEGRDVVFTKNHYSAFSAEQQHLVQMLRGRFVTEMYICGALSNISVYATALDAGRHGHDMTIVEDCCGFRSDIRHVTAMRQLIDLTGCEVINLDEAIAQLQPPKKDPGPTRTRPPLPSLAPQGNKDGGKQGGGDGKLGAKEAEPRAAMRTPVEATSTGLSPAISKISLELGGSAPNTHIPPVPSASTKASGPAPAQSKHSQSQPAEVSARQTSKELGRSEATTRPAAETSHGSGSGSGSAIGTAVHGDAPLEARGEDDTTEGESDEGESLRAFNERLKAARAARRAATNQSDARLPRPSPRPPSASANADTNTHAEQSRTRIKTPQRPRASTSPEEAPASTGAPAGALAGAAIATAGAVARETARPRGPDPNPNPPRGKDPTPTVKTPKLPETRAKHAGASRPRSSSMAESKPTVSEPLCEGDTTIVTRVLPAALAESAFDRLLSEVSWAGMSHLGGEVPRRVAVQGAVDGDGNMPVYRHPSDESPPLLPFSPTVLAIKEEVEKHLGHPLNHVLIQHYRSGNDYISEHSDKTLDIVPGSFVAVVSLGAQRTMLFRTKRPRKDQNGSPAKKPATGSDEEPAPEDKPQQRQIQRAPLPHNSLCSMGLQTNMRWLHAIRQDKRADRDKTAAELSHGGARISLTFRHIGTFLDATQSRIWGQGAAAKTRDGACAVVNGQTPEAVRMLQAFGAENNSSEFDWDAMYGEGFNVLHMGTPKRFCAGTKDKLANMRVALALAELGIAGAKGSIEGDVRFEDNDVGRTVVDGHDTVLRYLDAVYGAGRRYDQMAGSEVAKRFGRLQRGLDLLGTWRAALEAMKGCQVGKPGALASWARKQLAEWEKYAEEAAPSSAAAADSEEPPLYICGGSQASPADFALWPVLYDMVRECGEDALPGGHLRRYYHAFGKRSAVAKALGSTSVDR